MKQVGKGRERLIDESESTSRARSIRKGRIRDETHLTSPVVGTKENEHARVTSTNRHTILRKTLRRHESTAIR